MFFVTEKLSKQLSEVQQLVCRQAIPLGPFKFFEGDCPGAEDPQFDDHAWRVFHTGETWGGYDVTAWFRLRLQIPEALRDHRLYVRFQAGPRDGGASTAEAMLFLNGHPLQGIDVWHETAWLPPEEMESG